MTVTTIGVQRIIDSVEEQFIEELNEEYFGYANNTIKSILHHLWTNWWYGASLGGQKTLKRDIFKSFLMSDVLVNDTS